MSVRIDFKVRIQTIKELIKKADKQFYEEKQLIMVISKNISILIYSTELCKLGLTKRLLKNGE